MVHMLSIVKEKPAGLIRSSWMVFLGYINTVLFLLFPHSSLRTTSFPFMAGSCLHRAKVFSFWILQRLWYHWNGFSFLWFKANKNKKASVVSQHLHVSCAPVDWCQSTLGSLESLLTFSMWAAMCLILKSLRSGILTQGPVVTGQ